MRDLLTGTRMRIRPERKSFAPETATDRHIRFVTNLIQIKAGAGADKHHCCNSSLAEGPGRQAERSVLMVPTHGGVIRVAEADDKLLIFDISDDALERAAPIIGGVASVVTLNFGTAIVGNCACPCMED